MGALSVTRTTQWYELRASSALVPECPCWYAPQEVQGGPEDWESQPKFLGADYLEHRPKSPIPRGIRIPLPWRSGDMKIRLGRSGEHHPSPAVAHPSVAQQPASNVDQSETVLFAPVQQ